jgi:CHAT domain-containing protein
MLHGTFLVKGKAEPLEIYRVVWRDDEAILETGPKVRLYEVPTEKGEEQLPNVLHLEVTRAGDCLKISVYERIKGDENTIRHYEEVPVSMELIRTRCREMVDTLNKANRRGRVTREVMVRLREIGQILHDELFTLNVKDKLTKTKADYLRLHLDDQLVHIPWELLNDGQRFLCQRFNMGRLVKTRQTLLGIKSRALARPMRMLILADPAGDLNGAYTEGTQIRDYVDLNRDFINVTLRSDNIAADSIKGTMRKFDVVHFAGHADYNPQNPQESGWRLSDGSLKSKDIAKMVGTAAMPALVFSNACQSARTEEWALAEYFQDELFGLANAFLLAGVKHYVGTFWEILDEPSRRFALEFYKNLFSGVTVGEAIRQARSALIKKYGEQTIVWASYLLYGDPVFNYMDQIRTVETTEPQEPPHVSLPETDIRSREDVVDFGRKKDKKTSRVWGGIAAAILALLAVLFFGYPGFLRENMAKTETAALTYFKKGNYEQALNSAKVLVRKNSNLRLGHLLEGEIYFRKGKLDSARKAFQMALQASKGTDVQKAKALVALGRIASLEKQTDNALRYYRMATEAAPGKELGYLSQALLLDEMGNLEEALDLYTRAGKLAPDDRSLAALTSETRKKIALQKDQEKQVRVNKLVKELLAKMESQSDTVTRDGWTARPLTLWIMDFSTQGYSLQEGEDRLIAAGLGDYVLQNSRAQIVERSLLDNLLEELKLGTSNLADRNTALALGKILAARLILSGRIIHSGPQTHVSMRLIETETGRVSAVVSETIGSAVPVSALTDKLAEKLINKLKQHYPLRGKILNQKGPEVRINIGQTSGVQIGQRFKAAGEDVRLEVIEVQQDTCLAKMVNGKKQLKTGQRVEAD